MRRIPLTVPLALAAALCLSATAQAQVARVDLPPSDAAVDVDAADTGTDDARAADAAAPIDGVIGPAAQDEREYPVAQDDDRYDGGADVPILGERTADAMRAMMAALLKIPVGPIVDAARAADPSRTYGTVDPDATVGDVAGRGDPDFPARIDDGIRRGAAMTGTLARQFERALPTLIAIARDLGAQAERAARQTGDAPGDDPYYPER